MSSVKQHPDSLEDMAEDEPRRLRIVLAEDDDHFRAMLSKALRAKGHEVLECKNGLELAQMIAAFIKLESESTIGLVISDIRMPGLTGMTVLDGLRGMDLELPVILLTAFGDQETHERACDLGAQIVLDKPFEMETLMSEVAKAA